MSGDPLEDNGGDLRSVEVCRVLTSQVAREEPLCPTSSSPETGGQSAFASVPRAELSRVGVGRTQCRLACERMWRRSAHVSRLTTLGKSSKATPGLCSWLRLLHCYTISFTDFPLWLCQPAPRSQGGGISQGRANGCPEPLLRVGEGREPRQRTGRNFVTWFLGLPRVWGGQEPQRECQGFL